MLPWKYQSEEAKALGIIAWQYRKIAEPNKPLKAWDSCGEFTYNTFKDNPEYETRRLVVFKEKS